MPSTEFLVFTASNTPLENSLDFGDPFEIGPAQTITLLDDDGTLDLSGDTNQEIRISESITLPAQDIQILDITNNDETITVAAILSEENATTYLIPLDGTPGTTLTGVLPTTPDFTGPGNFATPTSNAPGSVAYCFAGDTLIATPCGAKRVDALELGEEVRVAGGGVATVRWIGQQTVDLRLGPPEGRLPVKITRGALGENIPSQDLVLTRDHAVLVGGILANAGALVNGTTIVPVPRDEIGPVVTYYHIDTCGHHLVLANDVPAETLIDQPGARACFDNYDEYVALFGDHLVDTPELFYPRAMSRRQLPARVREHLSARAAMPLPQRGAA